LTVGPSMRCIRRRRAERADCYDDPQPRVTALPLRVLVAALEKNFAFLDTRVTALDVEMAQTPRAAR
jgi:hypothetical protein